MDVFDTLNRPLRDLRVSVTDRCNFRCTYCMPKEVFGADYVFLGRDQILSFEEIQRLAAIFVGFGVRKVRLTGGEPMLRRDLETLIKMLAQTPGVDDLAMTTNGSLLAERAGSLKAAGLGRVTVSLDSLDETTFQAMNDAGFPVSKVLRAIDAAAEAGLTPVKIDMVVQRGVNDGDIEAMAEHFRGSGHVVRFIEYMDVGSTNGWRLNDVVSAAEMHQRISDRWELEAVDPAYAGEVAQRYRYRDGRGEIGFISSVTQPFCGDCTRARVSAAGELYTCLFGLVGHDLRTALRDGRSDAEIGDLIKTIWRGRQDRYSEIRSSETISLRKVEMSRIGG